MAISDNLYFVFIFLPTVIAMRCPCIFIKHRLPFYATSLWDFLSGETLPKLGPLNFSQKLQEKLDFVASLILYQAVTSFPLNSRSLYRLFWQEFYIPCFWVTLIITAVRPVYDLLKEIVRLLINSICLPLKNTFIVMFADCMLLPTYSRNSHFLFFHEVLFIFGNAIYILHKVFEISHVSHAFLNNYVKFCAMYFTISVLQRRCVVAQRS